jgi:hypothetical protein
MERQLRHLQNQPVTLVEIGPALIRMWNNIQQALIVMSRSVLPPHTIALPPTNDRRCIKFSYAAVNMGSVINVV